MESWVKKFHVPLDKAFRSSNGVPIERFHVDPKTLRSRLPRAYFSSVPWRGMEQLLDLWPLVRGAIPNAELVILSSLKVYAINELPNMEKLYERAQNTPGVIYRGSVGQRELREVASTCRALAYPCIFAETSCITAMEAMAAGAAVVSTSLGAMPETAWRNPLVQPGDDWGPAWAFELARVFVDTDYYVDIARQNLALSQFNSWNLVAERWLRRIRSDRVLHVHSRQQQAA
jgi:glycosyltransferase involved in cell wall biosynthesis